MFLTILFALVILAVVVLKYLVPRRQRCPQCFNVRDGEEPLCGECGWIYDVPGAEDDDYGELEQVDDGPPELR